MSDIEARLHALGMSLPPPRAPVANYLQTKRPGALLFVSGLASTVRGLVGGEVSADDAIQAAQDTTFDLLALVKRDIGDLDLVASVEQVRGFVRVQRRISPANQP